MRLAILHARMSSSRLPGKVWQPLAAAVYEGLHAAKPAFRAADIRAFLADRPDIAHFRGHRRL